MAPRVGLEPTAYRLTAGCSTIELPRNTFVYSRQMLLYAIARCMSTTISKNICIPGREGDGVAALVAGAVNIDALHTGGQVYPHPHGSGDGEAALQLLRVGKYLVEHELPHL